MRALVGNTRDSRQGFLFFSLLTLSYLGLASGAATFDSGLPLASTQDKKSDAIDVVLSEIVLQVKHWSDHCAELEKAKSNGNTRLCWWDAAKAIDQYTIGDHPLIEDVKRLRIGWLWRAVQLTLELAEPKDQGSIDVQPVRMRQSGPDPARLAGPKVCASIILSNYKKCLTATRLVKASPKLAYPRSKEVVVPVVATIDKKKTATLQKKALAASARQKIPKKEIVVPIIVRKEEVSLPLALKVQKTNRSSPKLAYPRSKEVVVPVVATIDKKKTATLQMISKTKALAAPVRQKIRKKEIVAPIIVPREEVSLPLAPIVQKTKNFSRGYAWQNRNAAD